MREHRDTLTMTLGHLNLATATYIAIIATLSLLVVFMRLSVPNLDPREPPLLKSRVPFIGHTVGLLAHSADYFSKIK